MSEEDLHQAELSRTLIIASFTAGTPIPDQTIVRIARTLDERRVEAGSVLFRQGDAPDYFYFVDNGKISMTREGAKPYHLHGKWVLGLLEASIEMPRIRTATVTETTTLVTAPAQVWRELFEEDFGFSRASFVAANRTQVALYKRITNERMTTADFEPPTLDLPKGRLDMIERLLVLSDSRAGNGVGMQALTSIAEVMEERVYDSALDVAKDIGDGIRVHLLLDGEFTAQRVGFSGVLTVVPGTFVPFPLLNMPEDWLLHDSGPVRTLSLPPEVMLDEFEEHPDLVRAVLGDFWRERDAILTLLDGPESGIILR
jgi:CRP-like cAMP-binding protein